MGCFSMYRSAILVVGCWVVLTTASPYRKYGGTKTSWKGSYKGNTKGESELTHLEGTGDLNPVVVDTLSGPIEEKPVDYSPTINDKDILDLAVGRESGSYKPGLQDGSVDHPIGGGSVDHPIGGGSVDHPIGGGSVEHSIGGGSVDHSIGGGSVDHSIGGGSVGHSIGGGSVDYSIGGGSVDHPIGGVSVDHFIGGSSVDHTIGGGSVDHSIGGVSVDHSIGGGSVDHSIGGVSVEHSIGGGSVDHPIGGVSVDHSIGSGSVDHPIGSVSVDHSIGGGSVDHPIGGGSVDHSIGGVSVDHSIGGGSVDHSIGGSSVHHSIDGGSRDSHVGESVGVETAFDGVAHDRDHPGTKGVGNDYPVEKGPQIGAGTYIGTTFKKVTSWIGEKTENVINSIGRGLSSVFENIKLKFSHIWDDFKYLLNRSGVMVNRGAACIFQKITLTYKEGRSSEILNNLEGLLKSGDRTFNRLLEKLGHKVTTWKEVNAPTDIDSGLFDQTDYTQHFQKPGFSTIFEEPEIREDLEKLVKKGIFTQDEIYQISQVPDLGNPPPIAPPPLSPGIELNEKPKVHPSVVPPHDPHHSAKKDLDAPVPHPNRHDGTKSHDSYGKPIYFPTKW